MQEIRSRFYLSTGETLDYVHDLEGDTLTIWGGERGSPAYYRGTFSDKGDTLSGAWHHPWGWRLWGDLHQGRVTDAPIEIRRFHA